MIGFGAIAAAVYALDLVTKILVRRHLVLNDEIHVLPFFSLVHVQNTGIAFGFFQEKNFIFLILGIAIFLGMGWMGFRFLRTDRVSSWIVAIILGGAMGNLTDRFLYGRVTDFLDFFIGVHHWPAFNVADSAICVGAAFLFIRELRGNR